MGVAGNNYRLMIEAQLDPAKIQAQINALSNKSVLNIKMNFAQGDMTKFEAELEKIRAKASSVGKITLFGDDKGGIARATVEYKDALGNVVKEYVQINDQVKITQKYTEDLAKDEKEISNLIQKRAGLNAKQADEMERAAHQADLFLAKSQNLNKTASVQATIGKAQEIKVAVSEGDINKVRTLNKEFSTLKASLQTGRTGLDSWSEGMKNALKQTIEYATSIGLVYGALNQLKEGIQYLTELDKEMTNIQLLQTNGAKTDEQIGELSLRYNTLAKSVGATTLEVSRGSVEWMRQGKTIEETSQLLKSSMMLSKLGNMESAQATEYLTSILNGFKLEAEDTEDVISKLIALDNNFATSTSEIASAMQRSSVSAQQAGVSMEELASMITVVSDVSRRAPESIGESFKTMFARYQDILSGQVDEDGQGINNVGKALERVGINIRDAEGGFKDFSDVLDELYPKWGKLSEVEQANITKALAGVRQRESLLVLLENQAKYEKALGVQMDATGLAAERYSIYLDSVEASQNRLTASWENLVMSSATSDMISNFYDGTSRVLDFVDALGGIPTILKIIIPLMIVFNAEMIKTNYLSLANSIGSVGLSFSKLGKDLMAAISLLKTGNSLTSVLGLTMSSAAISATALMIALASLVAVAYTYNEQIVKTQKAGMEENATIWANLFDKIKKDGTDATEVLKTYNEAVDSINQSHEAGGIIADVFVNKQKLINQGIKEAIPLLEEATNTYQEYNESVQEIIKSNGYLVDEQGRLYEVAGRGIKTYVEDIKILTQSEWDAKYAGQVLTEQIQGEKEIYEESATSVGNLTAEYVGFTDTLKTLSGNLDTINGLIEESKAGTLDFSDVTKIPEGYLDALTVEGDKLKLNISLIKEKQLAEAKMSYDAVLLAQQRGEATAQEVAVIGLYYNRLLAESQATYGAFGQTAWAYDELLWRIANDAYSSGVQIANMEGQALTSAQSIYEYLASGDEAFNSFVQQAALITGQSVEQVMQQINGMIQTTANNASELINYLGASSLGVDSGFNHAPSVPSFSDSLFDGITLNSNPFVTDFGGGGYNQQQEDLQEISDIEDEILDTENEIEDARKDAEDSLKRQLELYQEIIDEKKKLLEQMKDERNYNEDVEDKNEEISKIMAELSEIQLDDSEEAEARRKELQEELSKLNDDLEDMQFEHSIEVQENALDEEYDKFEDSIEEAIQKIRGINAVSLEDFTLQLANILSSIGKITGSGGGSTDPFFRSSSNTMYEDKFKSGDYKINAPEPINSLSPKSPEDSYNSSSVSVSMPITVEGNLDRSVIPDLEKMTNRVLEKINEKMKQRGYNRRADLFQI